MSQYPVINAGTTPTVTVLQAMIPLTAAKVSSTGPRVNNTLAADPDLTIPVAANARYLVTLSLKYNGNTTGSGDFKFSFSVPSGATFEGGFLGINNPLGVYVLPVTASSVLTSFSNGTGSPLWCMVKATLATSGTSGSFTLNWAENTTNATGTTLMAGSSLEAVRQA